MLLAVRILRLCDEQRYPKYLRFSIQIPEFHQKDPQVRAFEILLKARELEDYDTIVDLHSHLARGEHNKLSFYHPFLIFVS